MATTNDVGYDPPSADANNAAFKAMGVRLDLEGAQQQAAALLGRLRKLHGDHPEVLARSQDFALAGTLMASVVEALERVHRDITDTAAAGQQHTPPASPGRQRPGQREATDHGAGGDARHPAG